MRRTVRGLIIKGRKVLLVNGHGADFYWTPGGGSEAGETFEQTLRREIEEELDVQVGAFTLYSSYSHEDQQVENYLVEIEGTIKPGSEITAIAWYSSALRINVSTGFKSRVLPQLLQDNLID